METVSPGKLSPPGSRIKLARWPWKLNEKKIKHIVFVHYPGATCANIYLNNHSMRYGVFDEEALSINPDSTPPINIPISRFHSIEFNSPKHIQQKDDTGRI